MDLPLYVRVIWRFKWLMLFGFALALALAVLTVARVSPGSPHLQFRQDQHWQSETTLIVTQPGFPWGRSEWSQLADPARYGQLASIYAQLATSDAVKRIVRRDGPLDDKKETVMSAAILSGPSPSSPPLPLITVDVETTTKARAKELGPRFTNAFLQYLATQQAANHIPAPGRVIVGVVQSNKVKLIKGRSKTLPVVVFMLVLLAALGAAYLLENLRPRVHAVEAQDPLRPAVPEPSRRTA